MKYLRIISIIVLGVMDLLFMYVQLKYHNSMARMYAKLSKLLASRFPKLAEKCVMKMIKHIMKSLVIIKRSRYAID